METLVASETSHDKVIVLFISIGLGDPVNDLIKGAVIAVDE